MVLKALSQISENERAEIVDACGQDLQAVEALLSRGVRSASALSEHLASRLISAGGKRIRPYLLCLSYHSFRADQTQAARASREDLQTLAAVAEWVHTATLFHDDVLDASPVRRDQASAHMLHGNKIAILVGDLVYAEAFSLLMNRGQLEPSRELASTIKTVVEGEILQHRIALDRTTDFDEYNAIARAKTGALFGWCVGTGCWVAGSQQYQLAQEFGCLLGHAFQMADDLFDTFSIDPHHSPAELITEWAESSAPLPVVLAARTDARTTQLWANLHAATELSDRRQLLREILDTCGQERTVRQSMQWIEKLLTDAGNILQRLGDSPTLKTSLDLIHARAVQGSEFALSRSQKGAAAEA